MLVAAMISLRTLNQSSLFDTLVNEEIRKLPLPKINTREF